MNPLLLRHNPKTLQLPLHISQHLLQPLDLLSQLLNHRLLHLLLLSHADRGSQRFLGTAGAFRAVEARVSDLEVGAGARRGGGSVGLARGGVRADEPYWVGGLGGVGAGRGLDCVEEGGDFVGGPRGTVGKGRYAHGELH